MVEQTGGLDEATRAVFAEKIVIAVETATAQAAADEAQGITPAQQFLNECERLGIEPDELERRALDIDIDLLNP